MTIDGAGSYLLLKAVPPNILVIFDGTGPFEETKYSGDMRDGFCKRIEFAYNNLYNCDGYKANYIRGVGTQFDFYHIIDSIRVYTNSPQVRNIQSNRDVGISAIATRSIGLPTSGLSYKSGPINSKSKIYLVGHSRGGASAILLAQALNKMNISVEALFLFDAVNMTITNGLDTVPANVQNTYHAMRDPQYAEDIAKQIADIRKSVDQSADSNMAVSTPIRAIRLTPEEARTLAQLTRDLELTRSDKSSASTNWGNCGLYATGRRHSKLFKCSHGAMGGVPWTIAGGVSPDFAIKDRVGVGDVEKFMMPFLQANKLVSPKASPT